MYQLQAVKFQKPLSFATKLAGTCCKPKDFSRYPSGSFKQTREHTAAGPRPNPPLIDDGSAAAARDPHALGAAER